MNHGILKEVDQIDNFDFFRQFESLSEMLLLKNWYRSMLILDELIPVCIDECNVSLIIINSIIAWEHCFRRSQVSVWDITKLTFHGPDCL